MDRGTTMSLGPNQHIDTFMSNKQNQGFGEENGDFCICNLFSANRIMSDCKIEK
ncbi:hypothetical protein [Siminovitchia sp. 179-K 8D1 HS]|uniref:hypothetical protein n=1 Tax=Siminovitchia sp. 179-K 8D1 HS TaxID=3142385 RepID=UPI00399F4745